MQTTPRPNRRIMSVKIIWIGITLEMCIYVGVLTFTCWQFQTEPNVFCCFGVNIPCEYVLHNDDKLKSPDWPLRSRNELTRPNLHWHSHSNSNPTIIYTIVSTFSKPCTSQYIWCTNVVTSLHSQHFTNPLKIRHAIISIIQVYQNIGKSVK